MTNRTFFTILDVSIFSFINILKRIPRIFLLLAFVGKAALGYQSLITEALRYNGELGLTLKLAYPKPTVCEAVGEEVTATKAKQLLRLRYKEQLLKTVCDEAWQGKLHTARWNDDSVSTKNCFSWLSEWTSCPTYVVAGMYELYEHLLPTKFYQVKKIKISQSSNVSCGMCNVYV